jgi:hypothetical protein
VSEAATFWRYISGSVDRLVALAVECPSDVVSWAPPADGANSILALANHTLANAEENILGLVLGRDVTRDRESEFAAGSGPAALAQRWQALRRAFDAEIPAIEDGRLAQVVAHPRRGEIAVREVLIVVARHAAEHHGQAELTRDLAIAALRRR